MTLRRGRKASADSSANAGIEAYLAAGIKNPILMTNGRGVHASALRSIPFSGFVLARSAPRLLINQQQRRWERFNVLELRDKVMSLVGLGAIGTETRSWRGNGMKVIATKIGAIGESNVAASMNSFLFRAS